MKMPKTSHNTRNDITCLWNAAVDVAAQYVCRYAKSITFCCFSSLRYIYFWAQCCRRFSVSRRQFCRVFFFSLRASKGASRTFPLISSSRGLSVPCGPWVTKIVCATELTPFGERHPVLKKYSPDCYVILALSPNVWHMGKPSREEPCLPSTFRP